jgi:hypothetical protein
MQERTGRLPDPAERGGNWLVVDIGGGHFAFYAQGGPTPIGSALAGSHHRQLPLNRPVVDFG